MIYVSVVFHFFKYRSVRSETARSFGLISTSSPSSYWICCRRCCRCLSENIDQSQSSWIRLRRHHHQDGYHHFYCRFLLQVRHTVNVTLLTTISTRIVLSVLLFVYTTLIMDYVHSLFVTTTTYSITFAAALPYWFATVLHTIKFNVLSSTSATYGLGRVSPYWRHHQSHKYQH